MQKSFQFNHDKGVSSDHTHKYSNLIKATDRNGKLFTASYNSLSLLGKIITSHITFTKANVEIEPIIKKIMKLEKSIMPGLNCDMRRTM